MRRTATTRQGGNTGTNSCGKCGQPKVAMHGKSHKCADGVEAATTPKKRPCGCGSRGRHKKACIHSPGNRRASANKYGQVYYKSSGGASSGNADAIRRFLERKKLKEQSKK